MPAHPHRRSPVPLIFLCCFALFNSACTKASTGAAQSAPAAAATSAATAAVAATAPPAPATTSATLPRTPQDLDRERLAWLRRHSLTPAQKISGQDLPLDPNLARFLDRVCLTQSRQPGAPAAADLETEGRTLYEGGYDNPIFLRAYGQALAACGKTTESSDVETQALMKFPEPGTTPINVFMASAQLAAAMRAGHGPFYPAALAVQRAALRKLDAAIAEGAFTPAESPIALGLLTDNVAAAGLPSPWKDALAGLKDAKIDPWLSGIIRGMAELEAARAWIATGGSAAANRMEIDRNTHDHLVAAREALTEAARLHPEWPEAAKAMAELEKVTRGEGQGTSQVASSQLPVASDNQQTTSNEQQTQVASSQLPVASNNQQTANNEQQTTASDAVPAVPLMGLRSAPTVSPSQANNSQLPTNSSQLTTHNSQLTTSNLQLATGDSPLLSALAQGDAATANQLLRAGEPITVADADGLTPLHLATARRLTETMRLLLGRGAPVDARTPLGETPLHLACKSGAIESVRLLLDEGASPNVPSPEGWTPLDLAVQRQYAAIAGLLLERGANVNAAGRGATPLMIAVQSGSTEIARKLLDLGADPNATPYPPATPLHEAIRLGHVEIAINLIDLGAKVNVPDRRNRMPLHAAVERRLPDVAAKLLATGALPDARNAENATPLELAIEQGDPEMVQILLQNRASVRIPTSTGGTYLDLARQNANAKIIELLEARIK